MARFSALRKVVMVVVEETRAPKYTAFGDIAFDSQRRPATVY